MGCSTPSDGLRWSVSGGVFSVLAAVCWLPNAVFAEQFQFSLEPPAPLHLQMFRSVLVKASRTQPGFFQASVALVPKRNQDQADGSGSGIKTDGSGSGIKIVRGAHLVVLEKKWFDTSTKDAFCCTGMDVSAGRCRKELDFLGASGTGGPAYAFPVATSPSSRFNTVPVEQNGMFYVGVVLCGEKFIDTNYLIQGSLQTKSSHGFLSAAEAHNIEFSAILTLGYLLLLISWGCLCIKFRDQLVSVHYVLFVVLVTAVVASAGRYVVYSVENETEISSRMGIHLVNFLGICNFGVGEIAAVMICLGYGTSHDAVSSKEVIWLFVYGSLFTLCAAVRSVVQMSQAEGSLLEPFLELPPSAPEIFDKILCPLTLLVLSEACMFGSMANWGYTSLISIQAVLKEEKQLETLQMISSFGRALRVSVCCVVCLVVFQCCVQSQYDMADMWTSLWIIEEGGPQAIYCFVVLWTLRAFWPNENFRVKAFSQQIGYDDAELDNIIDQIDLENAPKVEIDGSPSPKSDQNRLYLE